MLLIISDIRCQISDVRYRSTVAAPLLVISALPREIAPLARRLMGVQVRGMAGLAAWQATLSARTVVLVATGCGPGPTTAVLGALIQELEPACIVSTGVCGALVPGPRTGHLLFVDSARREGDSAPRSASRQLVGPAAAALSEAAIPLHLASMFSAPRLVCSPGDKARLAKETDTTGIDMESAWVAEAADQAGIPWLGVRAVLDEADRPPAMDYSRFIRADGTVSAIGILFHALVRPWLWTALSTDGARMKEASASLARGLTRLLATLGTLV